MNSLKVLALILVVISSASFKPRVEQSLCEGFLPKNNLRIPVSKYFDQKHAGLSQEQFNKVADTIQNIYISEVKALGGNLIFKKSWEDSEVNASATRKGEEWVINLKGGFARHQSMTMDSYAVIVCHEMGHHLGGAVKNPFINTWSTAEGGADYYSNLKCFRRYAQIVPNDEITESSVDAAGVDACKAEFPNQQEYHTCLRSLAAGQAFARFFKDTEKLNLSYSTPDKIEVNSTRVTHPEPQCRIDTIFQGSICTASATQPMDDEDYHLGSCTAVSHKTGFRPRCWFKPAE